MMVVIEFEVSVTETRLEERKVMADIDMDEFMEYLEYSGDPEDFIYDESELQGYVEDQEIGFDDMHDENCDTTLMHEYDQLLVQSIDVKEK